jgi:hypothetical protein
MPTGISRIGPKNQKSTGKLTNEDGPLSWLHTSFSDFSRRCCQKYPGQKYDTPRPPFSSETGHFHFSGPVFSDILFLLNKTRRQARTWGQKIFWLLYFCRHLFASRFSFGQKFLLKSHFCF